MDSLVKTIIVYYVTCEGKYFDSGSNSFCGLVVVYSFTKIHSGHSLYEVNLLSLI